MTSAFAKRSASSTDSTKAPTSHPNSGHGGAHAMNGEMLPPTSERLLHDETRPYFLWWVDCTVGELKRHLADADPERRAYWLGALLREANSRDVWLFTHPREIREHWPRLVRHLGRTRAMWAWLLGMESSPWPPDGSQHA